MKKYLFILLAAVFIGLVGFTLKNNGNDLVYPKTKKVDSVNTYFGNKIPDPYRWLEDDRSAETAEWVKQQNEVTFGYLSKIPSRDKIKDRLTKIWNYEKIGVPFKKKDYYFFSKNDGMQNQSVLYVREGINGNSRVLIDPNTLSKEGTTALGSTSVSKDAKYMAYSVSHAGSDWSEIFVLDIKTGKNLADHIKWMKFSGIAWKGNGFYYSAYDAPEKGKEYSGKNEFHKIYYHKLGDTQDKDELIYFDKEHALRNFSAQVTEDEKFLLIYGSESTSGNSLMVKDLTSKDATFKTIVSDFSSDYGVVDNIENELLIHTNKNAPKYQLVLINPDKPEPANWKTIIPQQNDLMESASFCGDKLVGKYLKDVSTRLYVYDLNGKQESEIKLPGLGTVSAFSSDKKDNEAFYSFVSFTTPTTVFKYDITKNNSEVYFKPKIDFKSEMYETKQVFYTSKDGSKIPMFITHRKGMVLNGSHPTFLYGYGGFNISISPEFRLDRAVFLENGGVYAVANMRGGGEYGEEWHKAGTKCNKQNVFDDFIAAADYLVKERYTTHDKLAIHGRSNGGLLVGAVMTQRPDICKVALPTVGVLDMLRYHKFTIGWAWATDYGTSDNKDEFACLAKYSPLHNVKVTAYPATMVITADHDDRVVPAHSFKFAATLQEKHKGTNPVLIRIDVNAGHGAGKPTSKQIEEFSDMWAFVFHNLGMYKTPKASPKSLKPIQNLESE